MKQKIILILLLIITIITSCKQKKDTSTPTQVMQSFIAAMHKADFVKAKQLCTPNSQSTFGYLQLAGFASKNLLLKFDSTKITIGQSTIIGDSTAKVAVSDVSKSFNLNFPMQKIDGEWKVIFDLEGILSFASDNILDTNEPIKKLENLELYNLDSMKEILNQKMKDANIDGDSLEKKIQKHIKDIYKNDVNVDWKNNN